MGTVVELFLDARARWADRPALRTRTGTGWIARSWTEWHDTARAVALALGDLGVRPGDRVALLARARREGAEMALGAALAGAVLVTLPLRVDDDALEKMLHESSPGVLVVDDPVGLSRVFTSRGGATALREGARSLRRIVMLDTRARLAKGDAQGRVEARFEDVVPVAERSRVMRWSDLMAAGRRLLDRAPEVDLAGVRAPDDVVARVYTAGRRGASRAVEISHAHAVASAEALAHHLALREDDEQLVVAPLSSVFSLSQLVTAIRCGISTAFADPNAPPESSIAEVQPTVVAAPPSFYERLRDEALARVQAEGRMRRAVIDEALSVGHRVASLAREGNQPGALLRAEHRVACAVALDALRACLGTRLRFAVSAGGALAVGVAEWFHAVGVLVLEGYGLAEAAGVTHLNTPEAYRFGTAGRGLPGVSVTLGRDGEIVLRGPMIAGEIHTGDRGSVDADGFLTLLGRVRDA